MELGEAVLRLTTDKTGLESGMKNAKQAGVDMQSILAGVGTAFTAAAAFATKLINAWGEQEDATDRLKAAFKAQGHEASVSADAVAQLASKLQLTTRFGDETTIAAASVLESLTGMSSEMINRAIPAMQDMATAMGTDLSSAATLMARGVETGNLSIGRLKIEIDKNLPPAERFEKILGVMNQRFGGMAEALGKNTIGRLTVLKGQLGELAEAGGRALKEFLVPFAQVIIPLIKNIADFASSTMDLRDAQRAVDAGTATTAQALLKWADTAQDAKGKIKSLSVELEAYKKTVDAKTLIGQSLIEKMTYDLDHQKDVLAFANNQIKGYTQLQAEAEAASNEHADVIIDRFNPSIDDMAIRWMALGKAIEKAQDYHLTFFYRADSGWNQMVNDMKTGSPGIVDGWSKIANEMTKVEKFFLPQSDLRTGIRDTAKVFDTTYENILGSVSTVLNQLSAISSQYFQNQNAALDTWYKNASAANKANKDDTVEQAAAKVAAQEALDKEYHDKQAAIKKAEWESNKGIAIANVIVSTIEAVMKTLAAYPWPLNLIPAAIMGGLGAAQLALIASTPEPSFAQGGDFTVPPGYPNDSYSMRVESGEHVSVTPAGEAGSQVIHNTLILDGQIMADWYTKASRNGRILTRARSVVP